MEKNWFDEILETPAKPSPTLGICGCGHEGIAGNAECFICGHNTLIEEEMKNRIYCKNCGVVPLPRGHIELCTGCINDIVAWLDQEDLVQPC